MAARTSDFVERMLALPETERRRLLRSMPPEVRREIPYSYRLWARPDQLWTPGPEIWTVFSAGRGFGKTWVGGKIAHMVAMNPQLCGGRAPRGPDDRRCGEGALIGICGRTAADVRETLLYGPSGLLTTCPPWERPEYKAHEAKLEWPNGTVARLFSGDTPRGFLGANLGFMLFDEFASYTNKRETMQAAVAALRHGEYPRALITTTPCGDADYIDFVYQVESGAPVVGPDGEYVPRPGVAVRYGSTFDNLANLPPSSAVEITRRYGGTDVESEQLHGRCRAGSPDAIWQWPWIRRVTWTPELEDALDRVCVAIDPALTRGDGSAETGIVGVARRGEALYVLDDASGRHPEGSSTEPGWTDRAVSMALDLVADEIAIEENAGVDLVVSALLRAIDRVSDPRRREAARKIRVRRVRATVDKATRARSVVHLWEQSRAFHVSGARALTSGSPHASTLAGLERQITTYRPALGRRQPSDRMDALVWGVLCLFGDGTDRHRPDGLSRRAAMARIAEALRQRRG